ncbi:MAG: TerC family protein [Armatimonadetes bacterium]|nr:TerC family protein [Armatimonadota bacterium]
MTNDLLFPFGQYWWFYAGFGGFVLLLLALDLGVFHRKAHEVSFREATVWSIVWVSLALAFNYAFYLWALRTFSTGDRWAGVAGFDPTATARQVGLEFLTGYIVEKALAIDNIFVFVVVFSFFAIPARYQHRVLFYGIIGALVFRAGFIAMGSLLMQIHWVVILFGVLLILTAVKMWFAPEKASDPNKSIAIRIFRRFVPVTPELCGERFFVRQEGRLFATPLFVALLFLEISDIIFAVDSVPAIFALTREPLIVYTSNVFAILGLRAMYFLLSGAVDRFHLLKYGLSLVLGFVGLKMVWLNEAFGGKFPITWSLGIIVGIVAASVALSLAMPKRHEAQSG